MARKPQPGGDRNAWGLVMNEFLDTSHNPDGTIKPAGVQTAVATEVETALSVQLLPAVADVVAADSTVAAAAAAAVDAEPRVAQLVTDMSAVTATTDVLAALRFDPEHPNYGAQRGDEAEPGSIVKAANRAAIQLAADDARDTGGTLVIKGTYWIDATIQIECHVDGSSGAIIVSDTAINPAVMVGRIGPNLSGRSIAMPEVRQMGRTPGGGWTGNDVGIRVSKLNQSELWVNITTGFSSNVEMYAESGGTCYNNIYLGMIYNGRWNLNFKTGTGGWVNENLFIGGRFGHDTVEGVNVSGVRHIRIPTSESGHPFNNNYFLKPSIEGDTPAYHVEAGGMYNTIAQGRWEASPPKVLWGEDTNGWVIEGGYSAHTIQFTGTALNTRVATRQNEKWYAGGTATGMIHLANHSGSAMPVITVMGAGTTFWSKNPATDYTVAIGSLYTRFKREADVHPRIEIDSASGSIGFGVGTSAPTSTLLSTQSGNFVMAGGSLFVDGGFVPNYPAQSTARIFAGSADPNGSQSAGPGSLYLRTSGTIYRKATGTGDTGWTEMS